ncbi:hypothetical protein ACV56Z_09380 [Staphylococcus aureus]
MDQLQKRYKRNESYYNNALAIKRFFIALDKIITSTDQKYKLSSEERDL